MLNRPILNLSLLLSLLVPQLALGQPIGFSSSTSSSGLSSSFEKLELIFIDKYRNKFTGPGCGDFYPQWREVLVTPKLSILNVEAVADCHQIKTHLIEQSVVLNSGTQMTSVAPLSNFIHLTKKEGQVTLFKKDVLLLYNKKLSKALAEPAYSHCKNWPLTKLTSVEPIALFTENGISIHPKQYAWHPCWPRVTFSFKELTDYMSPELKKAIVLRSAKSSR